MQGKIRLLNYGFALKYPVVCRRTPPRAPQTLQAAQWTDETSDLIRPGFPDLCSEESWEIREVLWPQKCKILQLQKLLDRDGTL